MSDAYLVANPPNRPQSHTPRRAKPTTITLHTFESPIGRTSLAGAEFIRRRPNAGSYHRIGDVHEDELQLVPYASEAFHDGSGGNRFSVGISLMMHAVDWSRPGIETELHALLGVMVSMAVNAAQWIHAEYGVLIPPRRITKAESDSGVTGILAHADRDPSRRSDPGPDFPWTTFLTEYADRSGGLNPMPTTSEHCLPANREATINEIQQILANASFYEGGIDGDPYTATLAAIHAMKNALSVALGEGPDLAAIDELIVDMRKSIKNLEWEIRPPKGL